MLVKADGAISLLFHCLWRIMFLVHIANNAQGEFRVIASAQIIFSNTSVRALGS